MGGGPGGSGKGRAGGVIRSEKWEKHKNSTYTKIKFYIIFFLSTMDIKNFTNWAGQGGRPGAGEIYFFDIFLYYFINVMIKTLYISSFCGLRYIFYT